MNIIANVSVMFAAFEPCWVSGSQAELGDCVAVMTWRNALEIAKNADRWLESDKTEACEAMREWASRTGGWTEEEIAAWSEAECLALFAQNVAFEMRMLGSDEQDFADCVHIYNTTQWDDEPEYPIGHYHLVESDDDVHVDYYTGV